MATQSSTAGPNLGLDQPSAAQKLLQKHADHHATVEEVPDEELKHEAPTQGGNEPTAPAAAAPWAANMSSKAAGKQKAQPASAVLDTASQELFPGLGGKNPPPPPKVVPQIWNKIGSSNGTAPTNGASRASTPASVPTSTPASGKATPTSSSRDLPPSISIPGRNVETMLLDSQHILPRDKLRRPMPDIIKDINRKSRAKISFNPSANGRYKFEATGPSEVAQQALRDLAQQIGTRQTVQVPIPRSVRAHIIGKGGAKIKELQEKTGAKIQLPKVEDGLPYPADDDDESTIDVTVEGNALSAATACEAINKIVRERGASVATKLRDIPAEFYPFLANPQDNFLRDMAGRGVEVRVPQHQAWSSQPPVAPAEGQRPVFAPAANDNHIQLVGDRAAAQAVRAEIERRVEQLRKDLELQQLSIPSGRQQFIIGDRGISENEFFNDTGCAIIIPTDQEDDMVTVVGPADSVQNGLERVMDLAMNMQLSNFDISRFHRQAPGGASAHARNVTRYLKQRREIERLEREYSTYINTPTNEDGALAWELYSREGKNAIRAQTEIKGIVSGHPPSRMATIPMDHFYHSHLRNNMNSSIRQNHGVQLVFPEASELDAPLLLVYEGPYSAESPYEVPRAAPNPADVQSFEKGLRDARNAIMDFLSHQEKLTSTTIEVPLKFHERLRRFIKREQESLPANQPGAKVSSKGVNITIRGPAPAVESLVKKINAFVEQEKEDEKERGFITTFDFPQQFANHLIGKGGSNIRELRDKFDVEIQVQDGKVELKGPKAKAEAAKTHILSMGRQLADEQTHVLNIDPKFHRELIGAQGGQINRLQNRYKVHIFFPRSAKSAKDDESNGDAASEVGKPRRQQGPNEVIIRGPKKGADEARDELLTLFQYLKDNSFTATITLQQKQLPTLIGQGGAALEALRQQTGAKIDIPNGRDSPDTMVDVQIKGTKAQVAAAKKILEEKKAVFDDTVTRTIDVDRKYHRTLIGSGGAGVRDMVLKAGGSDDRKELSRTIQFPKQDSDGNTIKVEGRKKVVDNIIAQIEAFVGQRESQVTDVIDVATDKHRSLIGRGGDVKKQMESKFNVSIDIPRQGSGQTGVKITGQPSDVEKAKEHIQSVVKEQQGETVQVPRRLHHAVSNNGQFFRRIKGDHQVTVDHAGQPVPARPAAPSGAAGANGGALPLITDDADASADAHSWQVVSMGSGEDGDIPWVLRGSPENVEKAKKALENALEQAKKNDTVGYLILSDPRTYRHVIGQGGKKVESIRKQSGCKVNVPRNNDEAIEVLGSKDSVEKAKDLILAAVRDGVKGTAARD